MSCLSADMLEEDDFEYDDDIFCDVMTHSSPIPCDMGLTDVNKSVCSLQDEVSNITLYVCLSVYLSVCLSDSLTDGNKSICSLQDEVSNITLSV